jgi:hypothetical protein
MPSPAIKEAYSQQGQSRAEGALRFCSHRKKYTEEIRAQAQSLVRLWPTTPETSMRSKSNARDSISPWMPQKTLIAMMHLFFGTKVRASVKI